MTGPSKDLGEDSGGSNIVFLTYNTTSLRLKDNTHPSNPHSGVVGPLLVPVRTGLCSDVICVGSHKLLDVRLNMFVRCDLALMESLLVL